MKYSKNYRQQLIEKIVDLEIPQNMRFYIMIIWSPTLKAQMKTTVHQVIPALIWMSTIQRSKKNKAYPSKNKLIEKHLCNYSHNDQNIIMLLRYTKQGSFHGLKQKPGLSLIITRYSENFLKTTEISKAGLQERLRMSMSNIFLVKFIIGSLSAKNL